jgi:hypothetical protein
VLTINVLQNICQQGHWITLTIIWFYDDLPNKNAKRKNAKRKNAKNGNSKKRRKLIYQKEKEPNLT